MADGSGCSEIGSLELDRPASTPSQPIAEVLRAERRPKSEVGEKLETKGLEAGSTELASHAEIPSTS
jgi:hypothetical protein